MNIPHAERITASRFLPPWLGREHEARYVFCRQSVTGKHVLDCGSGEGRGSLSIARGEPARMVSLDRSVEAVSALRAAGPLFRPVAGSAESLPLRARSFDTVIALEVIEHFARPDLFLAEVATILRPDGVFICSTPNRVVRNPMAPLSSRPLNPWHLREWTAEELRDLLAKNFEHVELFGQQPQSRFVTRLFNGLGRIWKRGAAILRQLFKFTLLVREPKGIYDVQSLDPGRDFEFLVCRCSGPLLAPPRF